MGDAMSTQNRRPASAGGGPPASVDALHPDEHLRRPRGAGHGSRRGPLGVGQPGPALPRRPLGLVRGAGRARPQGAGGGRGRAGQPAGLLPAVELRPSRTPSSCRSGWRRWRPGRSTGCFSPPAAAKRWSRRGSWPGNISGPSASPAGTRCCPATSPTTARPWAPCRSPDLPAIKEPYEPLVPGSVRVANTNFYRAPEHGDDLRGLRPVGRRRHRAAHPDGRAGVGGGRVPGAGAKLGGLLPATAGLLPAGARDLRPSRRAARVRRGHLRLRPAGRLVRRRALRLPAGHDHLRQGHDQRLFPAGGAAGGRPAHGAVPGRDDDLHPRLHLRRPSGLHRGGPRQPGSVREGGSRRRGGRHGARRSGPCSRGCGTCRSWATSAATDTSTASSSSRTRPPAPRFDDDESERLLRGFLSGALFDAGLVCRADDRGDPVVQLAPPLVCEQEHFDLIGADPAVGAERSLVAALTGWQGPTGCAGAAGGCAGAAGGLRPGRQRRPCG